MVQIIKGDSSIDLKGNSCFDSSVDFMIAYVFLTRQVQITGELIIVLTRLTLSNSECFHRNYTHEKSLPLLSANLNRNTSGLSRWKPRSMIAALAAPSELVFTAFSTLWGTK